MLCAQKVRSLFFHFERIIWRRHSYYYYCYYYDIQLWHLWQELFIFRKSFSYLAMTRVNMICWPFFSVAVISRLNVYVPASKQPEVSPLFLNGKINSILQWLESWVREFIPVGTMSAFNVKDEKERYIIKKPNFQSRLHVAITVVCRKYNYNIISELFVNSVCRSCFILRPPACRWALI